MSAQKCTGIAARWCPIHGDCTDRMREGLQRDGQHHDAEIAYSDHCSDRNCPLHGEASDHAEPHRVKRGVPAVPPAQSPFVAALPAPNGEQTE
jgi:hypothetical protein